MGEEVKGGREEEKRGEGGRTMASSPLKRSKRRIDGGEGVFHRFPAEKQSMTEKVFLFFGGEAIDDGSSWPGVTTAGGEGVFRSMEKQLEDRCR
ncbi:hypothetical protein L3X38_000003 [Prunus dulcis]|uniref:Uncharacterized protein n=1 Tax=Prunus dulcis TaxID=3755 RepID=A0AAD4USC6_PRUDU|nr:hypothetical protein L3X38_040727 [Prunus dulcis]KAI5311180.1 hypothetical protein L3X38_000003 [Prunus dulcis]